MTLPFAPNRFRAYEIDRLQRERHIALIHGFLQHTRRMTGSVWAMPVESLYQELTLPKPAPASVVAAAVTARMGPNFRDQYESKTA